MAIDGRIVWADLASPSVPSVLVGGITGSGKTEFLRALAIALAIQCDPDELRLTLVDPKLVSFTDFKGLPHLAKDVITEVDDIIGTLLGMVEDMETRYRQFARAGVSNLEEYRSRVGPMAYHVIIVDEYADLRSDKRRWNELETAVQRLGQKGRAAGFHLILATQRPDASIISPRIKANLALKVALKVSTRSNSLIILDEPGAERLLGNGDMFVGGALATERLQGTIVTKTELGRALSRVTKTSPPNPRR
jgi:S-DNA-T family DNA segregation ATPase FtsK/SpoIIIE